MDCFQFCPRASVHRCFTESGLFHFLKPDLLYKGLGVRWCQIFLNQKGQQPAPCRMLGYPWNLRTLKLKDWQEEMLLQMSEAGPSPPQGGVLCSPMRLLNLTRSQPLRARHTRAPSPVLFLTDLVMGELVKL